MPPITPNLLLFGGIAGLAALAALGVVAFDNAIRSALCLVLNFLPARGALLHPRRGDAGHHPDRRLYRRDHGPSSCFVIMLLNLGAPHLLKEKFDVKKPLGALLGGVLILLVGAQVLPELVKVGQTQGVEGAGGPQAIGRALFTDYVVPFESVSVLLLVGIVGSILLAKRRLD